MTHDESHNHGEFMTEKKEIKETKELIAGLKEAVKAGKKVRDIVKDGVGADDIAKAIELVKAEVAVIPVYEAAAKDVSLVKAELQDLDKDELVELFLEIVQGVREVEAA